ncbi:zinc dependent phospholipase C family protein [Hymenobacter sp. BT186]|uniref:Zinc dependent phospholipase C family protein n=1 Tax=Hymenobacter telluris TaxID=2816474 RepID=A0A939JAP7_9BACT|nr:zinc dependent phospholipase C family protein [Hymenobacter telluris]MBO0360099.1 zinc dependent phospholipase C family protein [Hymenobacter telluris]MBW3376126.1 zinc dependent phospholipase C family protein [Hymenobacter norwichensis]
MPSVFRLLLVLLLALPATPAAAYSVLTHQAVIDSTWERCLVPLLRQRYPTTDSVQLMEAKSYAYGGAILQDMGYYPLGAEFFTNLTHYVRSGDFVRNLLRQARNPTEYAFALGALSHYAADNVGHPEGTNRIMPTVYPDLRAEYGPIVTYENAPIRHTELEFSFDVVQVAAGRYRTQDYHKAVGFRVSKPVLERAFRQTYGLELGQVFLNVDVSVASFRFAVNQLLPAAARAAWHSQHREIRRVSPRARRREYLYKTNRRRFEQEFGTDYEKPGFGARMAARVINLLPKIGPLKTYAFELPSAEGERQFRQSYRAVLGQFCTLTAQLPPDTTARSPHLLNTNLDTGQPARATAYQLADESYGELLRELHKRQFEHLTPALREELLTYFANGIPTPAQQTDHKAPDDDEAEDQREDEQERQKTAEALEALRQRLP